MRLPLPVVPSQALNRLRPLLTTLGPSPRCTQIGFSSGAAYWQIGKKYLWHPLLVSNNGIQEDVLGVK